jgi:hypothetical protein
MKFVVKNHQLGFINLINFFVLTQTHINKQKRKYDKSLGVRSRGEKIGEDKFVLISANRTPSYCGIRGIFKPTNTIITLASTILRVDSMWKKLFLFCVVQHSTSYRRSVRRNRRSTSRKNPTEASL